MNYIAMLYFCY